MDVTYLYIPGRGWWYAVTLIDYYSRYLLAAKVVESFSAAEVIRVLDEAREEAEGISGPLPQQPHLVTDNGSSFTANRFKKHVYPDGTTHLIFEPLQFIEKLAALDGPPRANLLHDHGYLAPCASWRKKIVPAPPEPEPARHIDAPLERFGQPPPLPPRPTGTRWFPWALLLWRSLQIDALLCPRCGSRMKILAYLTDPPVVEAVLDALERPSQAPTVSPARSQLQLEYCQAPPGPRPARGACVLGAQGKIAGERPPEPGPLTLILGWGMIDLQLMFPTRRGRAKTTSGYLLPGGSFRNPD